MASAEEANAISQDRVPTRFRVNDLKSLKLFETTIGDLQSYLAAGRITSVEYVEYCIERIRTVCSPNVERFSLTLPRPLAQPI